MSRLNTLDWIALILVIVGAINWGLVGLGWNLVGALLASIPMLLTLVYVLVGISGVYVAFILKRLNS